MNTRAFPISQSIQVSNKNIETVYKILLLWLSENNCMITRQTPQEEIEAEYSGDYPLFEVGPRDIYPKSLYIRVSTFGRDVQINIMITQRTDGRIDDGYIYWGTRLQGLYEALGVVVDDTVMSELFPESVLRENIDIRTKRVAAIIIVSILIVAFLWDQFRDMALMYKSVILIPIVALAFWDLQIYRRRLKVTQSSTI